MSEHLKQTLFSLLGGWPDRLPTARNAQCCDRLQQDQLRVERLVLEPTRRMTPMPEPKGIPAILTQPATNTDSSPTPVVLYCHAHGHDYALGKEELLTGRPALHCGPYAPALASAGIAALCIDLPAFGERQTESESALSKRLLWQGDTLFGAMLRDLASAVDYLETRADLDCSRLTTLGLSMGSTLGWWLAALDDRVTAVAELCCLSDIASLVSMNVHDAHGIYLTVPGLLCHASTLDINRLIIPKPHLCAIGGRDSLTPPQAIMPLADALAKCYAKAGAADAWHWVYSPDTGHEETQEIRDAVMLFLTQHMDTCRQPR